MWKKPAGCLLLGRPTSFGKALSFTHELSFFFFFISPPRSAAAQWMAIECIQDVPS